MWFTGVVVVFTIIANSRGNEIWDIDLRDICKFEIPGKCGEQINKGCNTLAPWLMYMFDASTKLQSGILEGNIADYGSFDECLKIDVPEDDVKGKYCLGRIPLYQPNSTSKSKPQFARDAQKEISGRFDLTIAWCIPASCSGDDIGDFIKFPYFSESQCQTKSSQLPWTTGDTLAVVFFAIMIVIIIASTSYDHYLKTRSLEPKHKILMAFSFLSNGRSLFKISNNANQIQCINGIRAISIMWIILGHLFLCRTMISSTNMVDMFKWFLSDEAMFIMSTTVSVDTFFMLSGMVMVYVFLKLKPNGGLFNVPMYYLHRYLRLTPSLSVLLLVHVTLIKHMGSGPLWPNAKLVVYDSCLEYWWSTILYIQNWVIIKKICIGATWYLSVDMQLFLLSPLILIPLKKFTKTTIAVVALLTFASMAACFHAAWVYEINVLFMLLPEYSKVYYMATYTRAAPWLIGTIAGYFLYEIKCQGMRFEPNKVLVWGLWIACLAVMCTCVFAGNNLLHEDLNNRALNSIYLTFVRPSWALAICWIIIACSTGYGGPVNSILSFWMFQFIAKISYNLYLLHLPIMMIFTFSTRTPIAFSALGAIYFFWGHFIVISAISTIWTLAFESPIIILEKILLGSTTTKKNEKEDTRSTLTITDISRKV